jgi:pimeloyl-ACP methyl ester carboxylesterase
MKYQINGVGLNVREQGEGDTALLFLHYWGGSSRTWAQVVQLLQKQYRCIAYDHRGWGDSDATESGYHIEELADDAAALIQHLRLDQYALVGHSMGGKVAQVVASCRPLGLQALILVAPAPPVPMAVPEAQRKQMIEAYGSRQGVEAAIQYVLTANELPADTREIIIEDTLKGAPAAKRAWPASGMIEDISEAEAVSKINVPSLILAGEKDQVERLEILEKELLPRIPGAQLKVIPKTGHLSPLEAPSEVAMAISHFLTPVL